LPSWLEAIATIGLLIFAYWQMSFVRRSTDAVERAATAASKALQATEKYEELALNAEKPYVFLAPMRVDVRTETIPDYIGILLPTPRLMKERTVRWIEIQLRNGGKGVAVIEEIYFRQCIASRTDWKITRGERLPIRERVIGPSGSIKTGTHIPDKVAPPFFESITSRYAVVGYVRYRDVYNRRFRSTFGYYYSTSTMLTPQLAFFYPATDKHNRIYEEK
jgi:hypothetical protein